MSATKQKHRRTSKGVMKNIAKLEDRVAAATKAFERKDLPKVKAGDTVKVHVKIMEGDKERIQAFEGIIIAMSNRGTSKSFTVRKQSHGVGVERVFLFSSPKVAKIEIVEEGKVRRSKLYFLRKLSGKAARVERDVEATAASADRNTKK